MAGLVRIQNVYLHPAFATTRARGVPVHECVLRIENYQRIVAAYGEPAAESAHGELLSRVQGFLADAGLACPEKNGALAVLVWDASVLQIAGQRRGASDWVQTVCGELVSEPVVTEFGSFHMKVGVEQLKGFDGAIEERGAVGHDQDVVPAGITNDAVQGLYRADMAAVSPLLAASPEDRPTQGGAATLCVCWRALSASDNAVEEAIYEALIGTIDMAGQIRLHGEALGAAERLGFVSRFDRLLLNAAIDELAGGIVPASLMVSISVESLCDASFWSWLAEKLFDLPDGAGALIIELRGQIQTADRGGFFDKIAILRRFGCRISIGQFGVCEGAFRELVALAPELVTIDKYFLGRVERKCSNGAALTHLVGLAHALGAVAIADGVDDAETSAVADAAGVSFKKGGWCGLPRVSRPWKTRLQNNVQDLLVSEGN